MASPAEVVQKYHLGGVIYFAWTDSVKNPAQITGLSNGLQKAAIGSGAHLPLFIATERSRVRDLLTAGAPAAEIVGAWREELSDWTRRRHDYLLCPATTR